MKSVKGRHVFPTFRDANLCTSTATKVVSLQPSTAPPTELVFQTRQSKIINKGGAYFNICRINLAANETRFECKPAPKRAKRRSPSDAAPFKNRQGPGGGDRGVHIVSETSAQPRMLIILGGSTPRNN